MASPLHEYGRTVQEQLNEIHGLLREIVPMVRDLHAKLKEFEEHQRSLCRVDVTEAGIEAIDMSHLYTVPDDQGPMNSGGRD